MKWIIVGLLLAGAAGAAVHPVKPLDSPEIVDVYEIKVYGLEFGKYLVVYRWIEGDRGWKYKLVDPVKYFEASKPYHYKTAEYVVDSLTEIRPTPAEMEDRP